MTRTTVTVTILASAMAYRSEQRAESKEQPSGNSSSVVCASGKALN